MIEKFNKDFIDEIYAITEKDFKKFICGEFACKFNEIIDVINTLVEENNIHEKQIDKLQMRNEELEERINYTLAKATDDKETLKRLDEKYKPVDKFAEQNKWIGKLCRFWDKDYEDCIYDILHHIDQNCFYKYCRRELGGGYSHCEPVSEDLIYKGE